MLKMKRTVTTFLFFLLIGIQLIYGVEKRQNTERTSSYSALNDTVTIITEDTTGIVSWAINDKTTVTQAGVNPEFRYFSVLPKHGTVIKNEETQNFIYSPNSNYYQVIQSEPADSFLYVTEFTNGTTSYGFDSAWVIIDSIIGVNDQPIAVNDTINSKQGESPLYITPLKNDSDPDRVGLSVQILSGHGPHHGKISYPSTAYILNKEQLFFPNHNIPYNLNLQLDYELRDMSYLNDTAFIYSPDTTFYGYDSIVYIIKEYKPNNIPPLPIMLKNYEYAHSEDADTATIVFFIEAKDYIPIAVNDTIYLEQQDERTTPIHFWRPQYNDLDADTLPNKPLNIFDVPFIFKDKSKLASATSLTDTLFFYHDVPVSDNTSQELVYKRDSNMATYIYGRLRYTYAENFSGVDSLHYVSIEKKLNNSRYPNKFRNDTSEIGTVYFVVSPKNHIPVPHADTIHFDWDKVDTLSSGKLGQYYDVLANDVDIDLITDKEIATLQRFFSEDLSNLSTLDSLHLVNKNDTLSGAGTKKATIGTALIYDDSVFYEYKPPYPNSYLIDSFKYLAVDASGDGDNAWVYITNKAPIAKDINIHVSEPFVTNEADTSIATNLAVLAANDDHLFVVFNEDNTLTTPNKSSYSEIVKPETGDINYIYHKGFTTYDAFQYIISDHLTTDTAWVRITNTPCIAKEDTLIFNENPFSSSFTNIQWENDIDVLANDEDAELIKEIVPFSTDTIETSGLLVWTSSNLINLTIKPTFFYKDSVAYTLTDIPSFYAEEGLFTRNTTWLYVIDKNELLDSDKDGIPNLMENGKAGYQIGEDTLDFDSDGLPNYLDDDADNDGVKDNGDCDGDGILNFLDPDSGCDEIDISNAFTPNNDGINDLFIISEIQLSVDNVVPAQIKIFDRWGSIIYKNDAYGKDGDWWDGTMGDVQGLHFGKELPNGIYLYYLLFDGKQKQGYVHIQR